MSQVIRGDSAPDPSCPQDVACRGVRMVVRSRGEHHTSPSRGARETPGECSPQLSRSRKTRSGWETVRANRRLRRAMTNKWNVVGTLEQKKAVMLSSAIWMQCTLQLMAAQTQFIHCSKYIRRTKDVSRRRSRVWGVWEPCVGGLQFFFIFKIVLKLKVYLET